MNRTLLLLRHAKSSWEDPSLEDLERPLATRGVVACAALAKHMTASGPAPTAVVHSPARRAVQTLSLIRSALGDDAAVWPEPRIYGAGAGELLELVRELPDEFTSVMLIGHNPGFEQLARMLAAESDDEEAAARLRRKYPTAALAIIGLRRPWSDTAPGSGRLLDFVRPNDLRRAQPAGRPSTASERFE